MQNFKEMKISNQRIYTLSLTSPSFSTTFSCVSFIAFRFLCSSSISVRFSFQISSCMVIASNLVQRYGKMDFAQERRPRATQRKKPTIACISVVSALIGPLFFQAPSTSDVRHLVPWGFPVTYAQLPLHLPYAFCGHQFLVEGV